VPTDTRITPIPIGQGKILKDGADVAILAIGAMVNEALKAHSLLKDQGVQATIVDCRFVKPIDAALIGDLARRIPRMLTVEENVRQGGFGSAVLETLNDAGLSGVTLERIGLPDAFVEHGPQVLLRAKYGLNADGVADSVRHLLQQDNFPPAAARQQRS
jgi:1-deoxy-D-xylulose-5-phosphate synthase